MTVEERAAQLERTAEQRFARWDTGAFWELVRGPVARLAAALGPGGARVVDAFLSLCGEGVGLGYLPPEASGASGFLSAAFRSLVPAQLPALVQERQLAVLATLWNLGENLETRPLWLSRLFQRQLAGLSSLDGLEARVAEVEAALTATPAPRGGPPRLRFVDLSAEDPRFLPGAAHFLAPSVICVHDRLRTGGGGRRPETAGIFLGEVPLALGAMGCVAEVEPRQDAPADAAYASRADPRAAEPFASAGHEGAACITLKTSQHAVCVLK